jgi:SPP1 gp7 family putative phage head morphogenesis protein
MKELENASARVHINRLEALKIRTQQAAEVAFGNELDQIDSMARKVFTEDYYHTIYEVQKGFGIGWEIGQIDNRKLETLISKPWAADGKNFSERIWGQRDQLVNELHTQLTRTCILGKAPDDAIEAISKKFNVTKNQAGRLVMTEQAYFHSVSQEQAFNDLDVEEFEIVATLDNSTSDICQEMDGKHFPMKDYQPGVTAPPFHVWCRSVTVPWFEDNYTGERAARNEDGETYYVPDNMTYKDWKKSMVDGDTDGLKPVEDITSSKMKTIDDCQSVYEAVDLMKNQNWFRTQVIGNTSYNTNELIDLDGVDLESAKSIYRTHEKLFDKFPQMKGKLNSINSAKLDGLTYAQCHYGLGAGGIAVNRSHFGNSESLAKSYARDLASNFHPQGTTWESIVMHELGHAVDDYLTHTLHLAGFNGWKPKTVSGMLRPKVMKATGFKVSDTYSQVSGYATKDAQEWFAECFAEYMDSDNPRPVAKKFGEMLEEILKGVQ